MLTPTSSARANHQAGFTLIEAMTVVVIISILGVIATYSVRKYVQSSKTAEATEMIGSIKAAEESYKDETFGYLATSTSYDDYYPKNPQYGRAKMQWGDSASNSGSSGPLWQQLGVTVPGPVLFVYTCTANNTASSFPAPPPDITITNWPTGAINKPWYVVRAMADFDGDGTNKSVFVGTSFAGDIFSARD